MIEDMIIVFTNRNADPSVRSSLSQALEFPSIFTPDPVITKRESLYQTDSATIRTNILRTLGRAYYAAALKSNPTPSSEDFFAKIKEDKSSVTRLSGAYALFLLAIYHPNQKDSIRTDLERLRTNAQPHLRMVVNQTLEMITIGGWVPTAPTPEQLTRIKSRLNALNRSEDHIGFAVKVALEEIAKIEQRK